MCYLVFWLPIAIESFALFHHCVFDYSRLSLSGIPRNSLKYFEISVPRHVRFAELRKKKKKKIEQPHLTNICVIGLEVRDLLKILWKRGEIAPLFHNIFYLLLDFHVWAGTRFPLRDKRLFEISKIEITRVSCMCVSQWCFTDAVEDPNATRALFVILSCIGFKGEVTQVPSLLFFNAFPA